MSTKIDKKLNTRATTPPTTGSTGSTASTAKAIKPEKADKLEEAHRGRKWYDETKIVNPTPSKVPNNPDIEPVKASDFQDWRKKA